MAFVVPLIEGLGAATAGAAAAGAAEAGTAVAGAAEAGSAAAGAAETGAASTAENGAASRIESMNKGASEKGPAPQQKGPGTAPGMFTRDNESFL